MTLRRSFLTRIAALALGTVFTSAVAVAQQQTTLPFRIFDSHTHFVSADQLKYPLRKDLPPLPHEREMREYQIQNPTTTQRVFGLWDANGVEAGVAVQYRSTYNMDNSFVVDTSFAHQDRVRGIVILDPADEATPGTLRKWVKDNRIAGIRTIGGKNATGEYPALESSAAQRTWSVANELGLVVVIMTTPVYKADAGALERIGALAARYPNIRIVLDHFGWPDLESATAGFGFTPAHLALRSRPNVYFKFTTLNLQTLEKAKVPAADFVRFAVDTYGADRIMWGSDFGNTKREYADLVKSAVDSTAKLTLPEQRQMLRETARGVHVAGGRLPQSSIAALLDRVAIENQLVTYLYRLDHGITDQLAEFFASDGVMDVENTGLLKGHAAIADFYAKRSKTRVTRHVMTNLHVQFLGEGQAKTVHSVSYYSSDNPSTTQAIAQGVAEFTNYMVRGDDGKWLITYRKASPVFGWRPAVKAAQN
jgi:predicted TIM-barrel fold metal-dependent hydrolase/ketosteroid isomerase-like protein